MDQVAPDLEKMSHLITDDDLKQGRNHRAVHRTRSSDAKATSNKDEELDLKFSIARSRGASAGKVL